MSRCAPKTKLVGCVLVHGMIVATLRNTVSVSRPTRQTIRPPREFGSFGKEVASHWQKLGRFMFVTIAPHTLPVIGCRPAPAEAIITSIGMKKETGESQANAKEGVR